MRCRQPARSHEPIVTIVAAEVVVAVGGGGRGGGVIITSNNNINNKIVIKIIVITPLQLITIMTMKGTSSRFDEVYSLHSKLSVPHKCMWKPCNGRVIHV